MEWCSKLLTQAFQNPPVGVRLRWISPSILRLLQGVRDDGEASVGCTMATYLAHVKATTMQANPDRTLQRILELAVKMEGPGMVVRQSRWIAFLLTVLDEIEEKTEEEGMIDDNDSDATIMDEEVCNRAPFLTVATVHAIKGKEYPQSQYNQPFGCVVSLCHSL